MPNLFLVILLAIVIFIGILFMIWVINRVQFNPKDSYIIEGTVKELTREDNIYWGYTSINCYIFICTDDGHKEIFMVSPSIFPGLSKGTKYSFSVINDYVYHYEVIK